MQAHSHPPIHPPRHPSSHPASHPSSHPSIQTRALHTHPTRIRTLHPHPCHAPRSPQAYSLDVGRFLQTTTPRSPQIHSHAILTPAIQSLPAQRLPPFRLTSQGALSRHWPFLQTATPCTRPLSTHSPNHPPAAGALSRYRTFFADGDPDRRRRFDPFRRARRAAETEADIRLAEGSTRLAKLHAPVICYYTMLLTKLLCYYSSTDGDASIHSDGLDVLKKLKQAFGIVE